jgi:hypothetical protein
MTLTGFITDVNYALRGVDDVAPTLGDDDWIHWGTVANRLRRNMYNDTKRSWASAFNTAQFTAAVTAGNPTYSLAGTQNGIDLTTFMKPGKQVYIVYANSNREYIDIVRPGLADNMKRQVFISGQNPQVLQFSWTLASDDPAVGGTLYLPGYFRPADMDLTQGTTVVVVDDPDWLVMATAAQVAFNDITYDDKFADLNGQANVLYAQMAHRNKSIIAAERQPTPVNVYRIRGFR